MFYDDGDVTVCEWCDCDDGYADRGLGYLCEGCGGDGGYWWPIDEGYIFTKKGK